MAKKRVPVMIEWRVKSQDSFLPAGDLRWNEFCTLTSRDKTGPEAQASMIVKLLNDKKERPEFEYRVRP